MEQEIVKSIIEKYCARAVERGATEANPSHPGSVVTASWVQLRCEFGCPLYGQSYCCPPDTPTPEQTRQGHPWSVQAWMYIKRPETTDSSFKC